MNKYIFDIETFPNYFLCSFLNLNDAEEIKSFTISWDLGIDELPDLKTFLDQEVAMLIGYNNLSYDTPILEYVYNYAGTKINKDIYALSQKIISRERGEVFYGQKSYLWEQMDLMKLMAFDKLGVSLKQCAINLKWKKIQDLPLPYDHKVVKKDIELIQKYNINDLLISFELYKKLQDQIELREKLGKIYDVNLASASDSKVANVLLEKFYTEQSGLELKQIRNLRTVHEFLWLKDCISPKIKFKTQKLHDLRKEIAQTLVVSENNFAYKKKLSFGGNRYELGVGGLHSEDESGKFVSDADVIIRDADVSSYYPNIIISNNIVPAHLDNNFIEILKKITKERVGAKKLKDKAKADGLKITINSIFGKLGSETFWLQDARAFLSVTVSGQLFLLMLIESLVLAGIEVVSANTDGIVCRFTKDLEKEYSGVCEWWQKETGFELEYTDYSLYIRSDVNNYLVKKTDDKTKEKGRYSEEGDLKKGYKYPIVPHILYQYFVNGISVEETLKSCTDILDFCISQKTGKDFVLEYRTEKETLKLQKTNRFYISNNGGELVKVRQENGSEIGLYVGNKTRLLNDLDDRLTIDFYDVNYAFYAEEAGKYIGEIEESVDKKYLSDEPLMVAGEAVEAEEEFDVTKIKIIQPKFGHSKGNYVFEKENMVVYRGLGSIKYLTPTTASELYKASKVAHTSFIDLLLYLDANCHVNSRQMESLIKMNFFDCFYKNGKLLKIFSEFNDGKNKYSSKLKQETQDKRLEILRELETSLPDTKISFLDQVNFESQTFGSIQTLYPELSHRYIYASQVDLKYAPRITARCLATGKIETLKVYKNTYYSDPFEQGAIIFCRVMEKKAPVKFVNGNYEEDTHGIPQWWITNYSIVKPEDLDKFLEEKK